MIRTTRTATISGAAAVLAVAAAIALTGCQSDPEVSPTPTPSPTVTTPSPSPSPTESKSPEDVAAVAAEKAVHDYYAMLDASLQNPTTFNPDGLKKAMVSSALVDAQNSLSFTIANGQRQIGATEVTKVARTSVDLHPSDNIPVVEFRVCWDVSGLNVVDKDGKSVVPADRAPLGVQRVGVANYEYPDGPWLVAYTEWKQGEPC